jgi:LPS sulfotransferase NodH
VGEDDSELDAESIAEDLQRLTEIIDEARSIKRGANAARKGIDQVDTGYEKLRAEALATVGQIASNLS